MKTPFEVDPTGNVRNPSSSSQSQGRKSKVTRRKILKVVEYSVYAIAGLLIFYSATPWIEVGHAIGQQVVVTRFYQALVSFPILGLLFIALRWFLLNALGVALWFLANLVQVTPILMQIPPVYEGAIAWLKKQRQPDSDNPTINKVQQALANWLLRAFADLGKYAAIAYLIEFAVNLGYYLPYQGGWAALFKDAPFWAIEKIDFVQFGLMLGSIAVVEVLFLFCLTVWRISKAIQE